MTQVKICGITNLEDALLSAKFGADALGFNFYAKSPRYIEPEKASEIIEQLPEKILKVGVFVNESLEKIIDIARTAKLDALQLHGEETPEFVRELRAKTNLEIIKAFRVSPEFKPEDVLLYDTDAILLDAYNPKEHGGTGETFDWEIARKVQEIFPKMYLAGGLSGENVVRAIVNIKPFAIDACSKIEFNKGKKERFSLINLLTINKHLEIYEQAKSNGYKISNIYDLLNYIHPRPALYLGSKSILRLRSFLDGFGHAFDVQGTKFDWKKFYSEDNFHDYVAKYFGWYESTAGWENIILKQCENVEERAVDVFFALLEEFKLEKEDLSNE
jgi:phosphoribosylanthranilate isomerase